MQPQEALREGWKRPVDLVYAWDHVRWLDVPLEEKRLWVREWCALVGMPVPPWLTTESALSPPRGGR